MKFGLINELQPGPEPWDEDREYRVYHDAIEQAVLAEDLGFDAVWAVEHHGLTGYSSSSAPESWLSFLAARTSRVRIGHGVVQSARNINHLVRVAERTAALDVLSSGRVEFGTGRGFTHAELQIFGVDPSDTRPMQEHAMRTLPKVWAEGVVELDDEFYKIPRMRVHPKCVQRPHPPMWMACTQPDSWLIAARVGAGVLAFGFSNPEQLNDAISGYRAEIAKAETPYGVTNNQILFAPPTLCAEDEKEALELAGEHITYLLQRNAEFISQWTGGGFTGYEYYSKLGQDWLKVPELDENERRGLSPAAALIKSGVKAGLFCVGTPDQCRDFVAQYAAAGVDQLALVVQLGALTNDQVQNTIRLMAKHVLPEFSDFLKSSQGQSS